MVFDSHNVVMPDGTTTMPGPVLAETPLARSALRALAEFVPPRAGRPPRVADLGCREGGFAIEFGRAGYEVVGIEARATNVERARWAVAELGLDNVRIEHDDVRNLAGYGRFDAIFCCGLLYHLDEPIALIDEMGALTRRLLILNTHYAPEEPSPVFALSEMVERDGVRGRWYRDLPPGASLDEVEANLGASWGNELSFWVQKLDLLEAIRRAGFPFVAEQYDFLGEIPEAAETWIRQQSRSQFLGLKPRA